MATVSYSDWPHQHGDFTSGHISHRNRIQLPRWNKLAETKYSRWMYGTTEFCEGSIEPIKPLQRANCRNCGARWHQVECDYCGTPTNGKGFAYDPKYLTEVDARKLGRPNHCIPFNMEQPQGSFWSAILSGGAAAAVKMFG